MSSLHFAATRGDVLRAWGRERERYRTRRQPDRKTHLIIENVTGPVGSTDVRSALAHEHMFVDFHRPEEPGYLDIDWHEVVGVCAESLVVLSRLGVDLIVDYTSMGVGRNVTLLRELSEGTGVRIVCPTGIYMDRLPPDLAGLDIVGLAAFFVRELDVGIDDTPVRAGFVKLATETGPTPGETPIRPPAPGRR